MINKEHIDISLLEDFLCNTNIGLWRWFVERDEMNWSNSFYQICGLQSNNDQLTYESFLNLFNKEDVIRVKSMLDEAIENVHDFTIDTRIECPNHKVRGVRLCGKVVKNQSDESILVYGNLTDISYTKEMFDSFHQEFDLITIIERVSDAFVALDKDWKYTYVNKKAGELFGRDAMSLIGKHIWTEFPEGIGQPFYKAYYKAMETQEYTYMQEYYPPYDLWFENHIYPSPNGLSIYFREITTRKKAEEAIAFHQEKLEAEVKVRTEELWEQNKTIKDQKRQIEAMIKEIHHRVKNNMQIIMSMFRLQSEKIQDHKIKGMFLECENRIFAMSLVHEKVYQSQNLSKIDTESYFPTLIESIISSLNVDKHITTKIKIDSVELPTKMMIPLGLLVNEILLNSMKHAFNNQSEGEIIFEFSHLEKEKFKMIIGDNGSGFLSKKQGLGLELIESFVETLEGRIKRTNGNGTKYEIHFGYVDLK